ncbi:sigma-70 family RNA polymerase sigma factor [Campylobacter coli]|nr:sigma-70 family RNA polymerase sigma factor [Campylobacter coli]HEB7558330.1 sigma-70 family RNA polymerase sigma factor [Campylobacter coli]
MTEDEAYKVHIQYTFNAFCKVVIRHAAIDKILKLRRRWEREVSLDYLMSEKFVQLAAALALLPEQTQEEIFRYYFLRQPQRVIGVHIGRTRSTAGRHIRLALQRLRRLMEGNDYE